MADEPTELAVRWRRGRTVPRLSDQGLQRPPGFGLGVEISCRVYKPRRPRESPLYRLVEQHLEALLRVWPDRFLRKHGPLRPVVERVLREFLKCGLLEGPNCLSIIGRTIEG
jgi:hypothetical protein